MSEIQEVAVPSVGESVTQGTLSAWLKEDGEDVTEGDELFELETDKATLSVPSPASGNLKILIQEGDDVSIGQVVATIGSTVKEPSADTETRWDRKRETQIDRTIRTIEERSSKPVKEEPSHQTDGRRTLSPSVRRFIQEHQLSPESITGTGKGGRITKKDIIETLEQRKNQKEASTAPLHEERAQLPSALPSRQKEEEPSLRERTTKVKMTTIRRRTAERLVQSIRNAAYLTTFNEVDMSEVVELRKEYGEIFQQKHDVKLGFMSFFVKACCSALEAFPEVNARIDGDEIVYNNFYDIGIAVSIERGLLVPVIRNSDMLSFAEIEKATQAFVQRAKEKKLTIDELTGGTFTITNGGVFGSLLSTPIPNPPQTAILGMHAIQKRAVVVNDEIVIRPMMYVALTYDHRIIDGKEAVGFLVHVKQSLESPHRLLLDI